MKKASGVSADGQVVRFAAINVGFVIIPIVYWLSACMAWALGTDYVIDVVVAGIKNLKIGDIIQFERMGFCRLDAIESNTYKFWFAHR